MTLLPDTSRLACIGESDNARFFELDEDVLLVVPHEGATDTAETAEASIRIQLDHLRKHARRAGTIVFVDPLADQDAGARGVYRDMPDPAYQVCFALVGGTSFGRAVAAIFTSLSPPRCPTRTFSTFEDAVAWVKEKVRRA